MPTLTRPDGVEIAWRERGDGPPVVLANLGYAEDALFGGFIEELARDHRMLSYDTRGTGASTRAGPYDIATDAGDLVAVLEAAGAEAALAVANGDGANRAVMAAARRPELIATVVVPGNLALPIAARGTEGLSSSGSVLTALLTLLQNDYRAGVHAFVSSGNPTLSESQTHGRVEEIVANCSHEAVVERIRSWVNDDPTEDAQTLGDRLWLLHHDANPWFAQASRVHELLPEAHHEQVEDGPADRPDLTAAVVRSLTRPEAR